MKRLITVHSLYGCGPNTLLKVRGNTNNMHRRILVSVRSAPYKLNLQCSFLSKTIPSTVSIWSPYGDTVLHNHGKAGSATHFGASRNVARAFQSVSQSERVIISMPSTYS